MLWFCEPNEFEAITEYQAANKTKISKISGARPTLAPSMLASPESQLA